LFQLKKISLGRGIGLSEALMQQFKRESISRQSFEQRLENARNSIHDTGKITQEVMRRKNNWTYSQMARVHTTLIVMYKGDISWDKKTRTYTWLESIQENLL